MDRAFAILPAAAIVLRRRPDTHKRLMMLASIVTATDATGTPIPTFPRSFSFTILGGANQSWTKGFSVNFATTVTWTATATGEFEVNPGNNTVTAATRVTGGGGGRR